MKVKALEPVFDLREYRGGDKRAGQIKLDRLNSTASSLSLAKDENKASIALDQVR